MQFCVIKTQWNLDTFTSKNSPVNGTGGFFSAGNPFRKPTGCNDSSIKRGSESELAVVLQRLAN